MKNRYVVALVLVLLLSIAAFAANQSITIGSGGNDAQFQYDPAIHQLSIGHIATPASFGTAPTANTCGGSPTVGANSNDTAGAITVGSAPPATCTVNFGVAYQVAPECFCTNKTSAARACQASASTSVLTLTESTATASDVLGWFCIGH